MELTLTPVNSSALNAIGYDSGTSEIVVEMKNGVRFAYPGTEEEYEAFRTAPSVGSHYARVIKPNRSYRRL